MSVVIDASALLAWLQHEPGAEQVQAAIDGGLMSAVNWAEVIQKARQHQVDVEGLLFDVQALGLEIVAFDAEQADRSGRLWSATRPQGLSLGDRSCLALALMRSLPVLTTDRAWEALDIGVPIRLLR